MYISAHIFLFSFWSTFITFDIRYFYSSCTIYFVIFVIFTSGTSPQQECSSFSCCLWRWTADTLCVPHRSLTDQMNTTWCLMSFAVFLSVFRLSLLTGYAAEGRSWKEANVYWSGRAHSVWEEMLGLDWRPLKWSVCRRLVLCVRTMRMWRTGRNQNHKPPLTVHVKIKVDLCSF